MEKVPTSFGKGKKVLIALILTIGFIALFESLASIYYYFALRPERREMIEIGLGIKTSTKFKILRYRPHPYFNYVGNPAYVQENNQKLFNSHGFRQPEWPAGKARGVIRIVTLGGSTTFGLYGESWEETWPAQCQKELRSTFGSQIEVVNLGIMGYTTHELLGVLTMLVPTLCPDIVLIHVGANDSFAAAYPDEGGPDNTNFRFSWNYRPIQSSWLWIMRKSYLFRLLAIILYGNRFALPGDMFRAFQYPHPSDQQAEENARHASGKYFCQNVRNMVAFSRSLGAIPVLVTHPLNPKWDNPAQSFDRLVIQTMLHYNRIIQNIAAEFKAPIIDLYPLMRDPTMFFDAIHESNLGKKVKIKAILAQLTEEIRRCRSGNPQSTISLCN